MTAESRHVYAPTDVDPRSINRTAPAIAVEDTGANDDHPFASRAEMLRHCRERIDAARDAHQGLPMLVPRCERSLLVRHPDGFPTCALHDRAPHICQAEVEERRTAGPGCCIGIRWITEDEYRAMSSDDRSGLARFMWASHFMNMEG